MIQLITDILRHHEIMYNSITEIQTGLFNTTFKIGCPEDEPDLIVRIAPDEDTGMIYYEKDMMHREPEIHKMVREKTTLPVPKIIHADFSKNLIPNDYLIMEFIEGIPMSDVPLTQAQQKEIYKQTGSYLKELHDSTVLNTYGYPGNNCMAMKNSWNEAFYVMWSKLISDISSIGVYNKDENHFARKQLDKFMFAFDRRIPASLLHMDIWSQNILLDSNNKISAILDWDRALYGDPEIEFAVLEYVGFLNDAFKEGYKTFPGISSNFKIRQVFYYLYEFQKYIVIWTLRRPNPSMVKNYKDYALQTLKNLN